MNKKLNWKKFLSRHNMKWQYLPKKWDQGCFLGNGLLGVMVYSESSDIHKNKGNSLRFELGRTDVTAQEESVGYLIPRVLIGDFFIEPIGMITWENCTMELDLWNATLYGTIPTNKGNIEFSSFVDAASNIIVVDLIADGGEKEFVFHYVPQHCVSPFSYYRDQYNAKMPPKPTLFENNDISFSRQ